MRRFTALFQLLICLSLAVPAHAGVWSVGELLTAEKLNQVTPSYVVEKQYGTLQAAVTAIGTTTKATLQYSTNQTLTANLVVGANIKLVPLNGAMIVHNAYTVTFTRPDTSAWGEQQIFSGTGAVSGLTYSIPEWFGAKADWNGTTGTDSGTAINAALSALTAGGTFELAGIRYYSTVQTVTGIVPTVVRGRINTGTTNTTLGTSITYAAGVSGLKLRGVGSHVEDLTLLSLDAGVASSAIGIDVWSPKAVGRNVSVQSFGSHGWRFDSTVAGNINLPRLDNCFSHGNGGNGFHINGTDANAGVYTMINATANKGIQIYCKSARNHFIGAHVDSAKAGAQAVSDNSLSNYWNIYVEGASRAVTRVIIAAGVNARFKSVGHGFVNGETVTVSSVVTGGADSSYTVSGVNNTAAVIVVDADWFELTGVQGSANNGDREYVITGAGTDSGADFEIGATSSMGVLEALFYAAPTVVGNTTAMQSWRIYERYSYRQLVISDRNGGYTQGKQWKLLNGVTPGSGDLQFNVANPDGTSSIVAFKLTGDGERLITTGAVETSKGMGLFGATPPISKPTVSGSVDGNAALQSLLDALAPYGLFTDSTTP